MATVERTCVIPAPPAVVWAVLADVQSISTWAPNVDHSCLLSDQVEGVGTTRRIQTNRVAVVESVETWEPDSTLSYRITGLPPVIKTVRNTWRLTPVDRHETGDGDGDGDGASTHVSLTTEIDAGPRPPQKLVAKLVGNRFGAASNQMLTGLTEYIAAGQGAAS